MKAAWTGVSNIMIQLAKKLSLAEQELAWICGKNISKIQWRLWQRRWNAWKLPTNVGIWFVACCCQSWWLQWPAVLWVRRFCKRCEKSPTGKASGLAWTHGTLCVCAHHPATGTSRGSPDRTASSFSSSSRGSLCSRLSPFVSEKTLKACGLTGLHLMAAEGECGSSGSQSPDVGDMGRHGCPKKPRMGQRRRIVVQSL